MATTKKSVKTVKSVRKVNDKRGACPCGCGCGAECECHKNGGCTCGCGCGAKYTGVWAAWRAFWRRGFCEWAGTSSRSEYWLAWVGNVLVMLMFCAVLSVVAGVEMALWGHPALLSIIGMFAFVVYLVAAIIPAISMFTRRMHDAGLSAWLWVLYIFSLVPVYVGGVWLCGAEIGLIVALLPTVMVGNPYQKNNK